MSQAHFTGNAPMTVIFEIWGGLEVFLKPCKFHSHISNGKVRPELWKNGLKRLFKAVEGCSFESWILDYMYVQCVNLCSYGRWKNILGRFSKLWKFLKLNIKLSAVKSRVFFISVLERTKISDTVWIFMKTNIQSINLSEKMIHSIVRI